MFLKFRKASLVNAIIILNTLGYFFSNNEAQAVPFSSIYQMALQQDPTVAGAQVQITAAQERVNQAQGALQSKWNFTGEEKRGEQWQRWQDGQRNTDLRTRQYGLQYSYPVYRPAVDVSLEQSRVMVGAARYQHADSMNELLQRVSSLFFEILGSRAELTLLHAQQQAVAEQKAVAKRSFDVGTVSITDLREAEAKYDTLVAQEQAMQLELFNKQELLKQLAGAQATVDDYHSAAVALPPLRQEDLAEWLSRLDQVNPKIQQALKNIESAQLEVRKAQAARYPTLDFTNSLQRNINTQEAAYTSRQNGWSNQFGFSLNVPLYNNETNHKIKEMYVLLEKAQYDLAAARLNESNELRQAYFSVLAAMTRYQGLTTAESSAQVALKANQRAYQVGMRINAEVLDAQSKLFEVQRDQLKAWYDAWLNYMKLKSIIGQPQPEDLQEVDRVLAASRK